MPIPDGNPQVEDGHIDIANELAEALAMINISSYESRVLWIILRKTYGWHKKSDWISLSQFVELTGLKKPHIIRAIKKLVSKNIITQIGNDKGKEYSINKHYKNWKSLPKQATLPKEVMVVTQIGNASLPKEVPTKETITKETITKEKRIAQKDPQKIQISKPYLLAKWFYEFRNIPAQPTPVDMKYFKMLLDCYPMEIIKKGIEWRLTHDPEGFWIKKITSASVYRNFGNWMAESSVKAISFTEWLTKNPNLDYRKFEDLMARADIFMEAFKESKKNRLVYFTEEDYGNYRLAISQKTREAKKEIKNV